MSTSLFAAPVHRRTSKKRAVAVVSAMLVSAVAIPSSPVSADGGAEEHTRIVVREGESIQAAVDAAGPGTKIVVRGDHTEQVWINKSGIELVGRDASLTLPEETETNPCEGGFFDEESGEFIVLPTLICVHPLPFEDFPAPPEVYLDDITIKGFDLTNPIYDAIGVYFTNHVHVQRNTAVNPGCDGIFVLFSSNFDVSRNTVSGSQFCSGIEVAASEHGSITRNTTNDNEQNGIIANDSSHVAIERNSASGNCYGINVGNPPDFLALPSSDVTIKRNTTNGNNDVCFPFGPDFPVGVVGILAVGVSNLTIERNTSNDNVSDELSLSAGGITVVDWPGDSPTDPPSAVSADVEVGRNTAKGNSSALGPVDLNLTTIGEGLDVHRNRCDVAVSAAGPEPTWCKH